MGIKLDDLFEDAKSESTTPSSETGLVVTSKHKSTKKKDTVNTNSIYEEYQNLVYLIDRSGSMDAPIFTDDISQYNWPQALKEHLLKIFSFTETDELNETEAALFKMIQESSEEELKAHLVKIGPQNYSIHRHSYGTNSKMSLVRTSVKDLVDRKFEKYPNARVALMPFNTTALVEAATPEMIKTVLDTLQPDGGTNIYNAVKTAVEYCDKYPSPVNVNHLVVVSDGEDWNALSIKDDKELLEKMKEMGVVIDYIYITSHMTDPAHGKSSVANMFVELCKEYNGEYVEVHTADEFKRKLIEYSNRLCLPPASV